MTHTPNSAEPVVNVPLNVEQMKALAICLESGRVSISEVQRKLRITFNESSDLCQSLVDAGYTKGLQHAPSLRTTPTTPPAAAPAPAHTDPWGISRAVAELCYRNGKAVAEEARKLSSHFRHANEAAPAPAVPQGWLPIETAPRDGTAILVMRDIWPGTKSGRADECNGHNTYVAEWWARELGDGGGAWMCYMDRIVEPRCPIEPTHWMPLPAPPCATLPPATLPDQASGSMKAAVLAEREACIEIVARHGGSIEIEAAIRDRGTATLPLLSEDEMPPLPSNAALEERIKTLMKGCGLPDSQSVYGAFKQFQNELMHETVAYGRAVEAAVRKQMGVV